jgi:hypothetical protein
MAFPVTGTASPFSFAGLSPRFRQVFTPVGGLPWCNVIYNLYTVHTIQ